MSWINKEEIYYYHIHKTPPIKPAPNKNHGQVHFWKHKMQHVTESNSIKDRNQRQLTKDRTWRSWQRTVQ